MQKYYDNNIESKFIKELLRTTYIPTVPIWKPGKKIIAGLTYIVNNYIVKCLVSSDGYKLDDLGNIEYNKELYKENGEEHEVNTTPKYLPETIYDIDEEGKPYFEIVEPYVPGKFYRGITTNFISNSSLYDPKTHYYLGEYLRMIRDLYNIDLMPYYNCWDGRYSDNLRLVQDDVEYIFQQKIIKYD